MVFLIMVWNHKFGDFKLRSGGRGHTSHNILILTFQLKSHLHPQSSSSFAFLLLKKEAFNLYSCIFSGLDHLFPPITCSLISFLDCLLLGSIFKIEAWSSYLDTLFPFTGLSSLGAIVFFWSFCLNVGNVPQTILMVWNGLQVFSFSSSIASLYVPAIRNFLKSPSPPPPPPSIQLFPAYWLLFWRPWYIDCSLLCFPCVLLMYLSEEHLGCSLACV